MQCILAGVTALVLAIAPNVPRVNGGRASRKTHTVENYVLENKEKENNLRGERIGRVRIVYSVDSANVGTKAEHKAKHVHGCLKPSTEDCTL